MTTLDPNSSAEFVQDQFFNSYKRRPDILVRAPGRITLLGAHVDYSEGWVLPAAIERSVWLAASPAPSPTVTILSREYGQQASFTLNELRAPATYPWLRYPMGVAWSLQASGHELTGMNVVIASDIPIGAGVSSSAAVETAMVLAWELLSGFELTGLARARAGQRAENGFLGVGSGIMDQFVCIHGVSDHFLLLDCRTLEYEPVPIASDTVVILADSGVRRDLVSIDYNARPRECAEAVVILRAFLPGIQALRDVSVKDFRRFGHHLPPTLQRRVEHVVTECARVLEGVGLLRQRDVAGFGELIKESQISSRDNYENSTPELDLLAETAWRVPGCYGARFSGGGYGGLMQVLAQKSAESRIRHALSEAFEAEYGRIPPMLTCTIADGAHCFRF